MFGLKVCFLIALFCLSSAAANAETSGTSGTSSAGQAGAPARSIATQRALALPKAAAGVFAGLTIGVPLRISRDIKHEMRRMAGVSRGDMGNEFGPVENVFVAATSIPYGIVSGTILGGIRGTERAFTYGARNPFCKESLGLAEPEAAASKNDSISSNASTSGQ